LGSRGDGDDDLGERRICLFSRQIRFDSKSHRHGHFDRLLDSAAGIDELDHERIAAHLEAARRFDPRDAVFERGGDSGHAQALLYRASSAAHAQAIFSGRRRFQSLHRELERPLL